MADKAVFLDRDDTLIEDPGYISSPEQVKLLPGVTSALVQLRKMGYKLIVVTNQSAVARGIITEATLKKIHKRINELLKKGRAYIDKFYYCPYHPEGVIPKYRMESDMRKPAAGMFFLASEEMGIDCSRSWMVGNSYRDVTAGRRAGCGAILIKSSLKPAMKKLGDPEPDKIAINMKEVVNIIKMYDWDAAEARDIQPPPPPAQPEPIREVEQIQPEPVQEVHAPAPEPIIEPDQREYETDEPAIEDWPNAEKIIQHQTATVPTEEPSPPSPTPAKTTGQTINIERTNALLEDVVKYLRRADRENMFEDYSPMKIAALVVQFLVLVCLAMSLWFLMDSASGQEPVQTSLGYAAVLQLMAIAFYMMHGRK
jgi:D-glycero-D-manno-heptose 1,7-bisphosphate phosphatase